MEMATLLVIKQPKWKSYIEQLLNHPAASLQDLPGITSAEEEEEFIYHK